MRPAAPDLHAALATLGECGVRFVVAGGVACAAHGLAVTPHDLDICCECTSNNLERLAAYVGRVHGRPARMRSRRRDRLRAVRRARERGYSWLALGRATAGWVAARVPRPRWRRAPALPWPSAERHDPSSPPPESFGLSHIITLVTEHGLLTCYCYEPADFDRIMRGAMMGEVAALRVPVQSLEELVGYNEQHGRVQDRLKRHELRGLLARRRNEANHSNNAS
jgi:hypothetical protein